MGEFWGATKEQKTAVISRSMVIRGEGTCDGDVDMRGEIIGNIRIQGTIRVGGCIHGDLSAQDVYLDAAQMEGKVESRSNVRVGQDSVVIGDISAESIVNAGAIKGDIVVNSGATIDKYAIVLGNICSETLQISNGARMEGMCQLRGSKDRLREVFGDVDTKKKPKKRKSDVDEDGKTL